MKIFISHAEEDETTEEERTRALLFVSDGENHVSNISQLINEAEDEGIVIFTAGIACALLLRRQAS